MACAPASPTQGEQELVQAVRSREVELQYRVMDAGPDAEVELWYTRDRGASWQRWGIHKDHDQPIIFEAPAEGLYGFTLIVKEKGVSSSPPPTVGTEPQRRVFIDYTPPLVQWDSVEPVEAFAARRIVQLRWTAHDANLSSRPVSLSYLCSIEQSWQVIEEELPNSGQYDWTLPAHVAGQVTLKLAVRDLGGHVVERLYGPVPIDRWVAKGIPLPETSTRPAGSTANGGTSRPAQPTTQPAGLKFLSKAEREKVEQLWSRGSWHAGRNEYAVAAERFREALEIDPTHIPSLYDLGVIHYYQKEYAKAIDKFQSVLALEPRHQLALRGMHESYIAQRQYAKSYEILQQLVRYNEKDARAWLDLGDVLFKMERPGDAREMWTRALQADPGAAAVINDAKWRLSRYGAAVIGQAKTDRQER
ncbi:MAG: tetratricopeptide repeat protein [Phycisphaerae bacterium]